MLWLCGSLAKGFRTWRDCIGLPGRSWEFGRRWFGGVFGGLLGLLGWLCLLRRLDGYPCTNTEHACLDSIHFTSPSGVQSSRPIYKECDSTRFLWTHIVANRRSAEIGTLRPHNRIIRATAPIRSLCNHTRLLMPSRCAIALLCAKRLRTVMEQ